MHNRIQWKIPADELPLTEADEEEAAGVSMHFSPQSANKSLLTIFQKILFSLVLQSIQHQSATVKQDLEVTVVNRYFNQPVMSQSF